MDIEAGINGATETTKYSTNKLGVRIAFADVSYSVRKSDGTIIKILQSVSGQCRPGHVLAIMGQSGSGKTSLVRGYCDFEQSAVHGFYGHWMSSPAAHCEWQSTVPDWLGIHKAPTPQYAASC